MIVPKIKKLVERTDTYIERVLPAPGNIYAKVGAEVKPYDHLGNCNVSHSIMKLPKSFKTSKIKGDTHYYQFGAKIGKVGAEPIVAPFNGNLYKDKEEDGLYKFREIESKYTLLSGVWGVVEKISEGNSVLLKTQTIDVQLIATTGLSFSGELIVFPNPWHTLEKYYLNEFSAGAEGKIIYVGNTVDVDLLREGMKIGVGGILAGSCDKETFNYAKRNNICLGILSGLGSIESPQNVFDYLKTVSNRFVLFYGNKRILRVPIPETTGTKRTPEENIFVDIKQGNQVLILEKNYFGKVGEVDTVTDSSIFVKLPKLNNSVEIKLPNFLVLG